MALNNQLVAYVILALLVALVVSFLMTPVVKTFAYKVGAIDVPKDNRRMHKEPIPRLGGLAIFIAFLFLGTSALMVQGYMILCLCHLSGLTLLLAGKTLKYVMILFLHISTAE